MTMFNWFSRTKAEKEEVNQEDRLKEAIKKVYAEVSDASPYIQWATIREFLSRGSLEIPDPLMYDVSEILEDMGLSAEGSFCNPYNYYYSVKKSSPVSYPNGTKVGDQYYIDGKYLGQCAYNLYKTFFDNPKRFKVANKLELMLGRFYYSGYKGSVQDIDTGVIFHGTYSNFEMKSKVSEREFHVLVKAITKYHEGRAERYEKLKQQRKERDMLRLYCTCEDDN